jgi:hypothetical protein
MSTLIEMPDLIQGTDEWHDQRRGLVTASVVGRLISIRSVSGLDVDCPECGMQPGRPCVSKVKRAGEPGAPIKTCHTGRTDTARESGSPPVLGVADGDDARNLTALLVAERITGYTDPTYMNDDMLRGIEDEPRAIEVYSEHYAPVRTSGFMVRDFGGFRIGYSPDGLVGDDGLVEVKSRRQKKQLTTILDDDVPAENMAQLQCGLLVSGREWIDYVSYCGGMPLYRKRVTPDPRWFDVIFAAAAAFEEKAAQMLAAYEQATAGLPMTERAVEMEMVL